MSFPGKSPHFFKFILSSDVQETGIRIPNKFMREHGKNLSNRVSLRVPGGALWPVELTSSMDGTEIWLKTKGWREFAQYYGIVYKCCLVFKYQGNSIFLVIILGSNASEIEYPTKPDHPGIDQINDDSTRKISPVTYSLCGKKRKPNSELNRNGIKAVKTEEHSEEEDDKKFSKGRKQQGSDTEEAELALRSAQAFRTDNPSFMVIMHPSYVNGGRVNIPKNFVETYLNRKHNNCTLQLSNGGSSWLLEYTVYEHNAKMKGGWRRFKDDNSLAAGDICVFELIDNVENILKVHVFRSGT